LKSVKAAGTPRIGYGYDIHRFGENRKLILGGVELHYPRGLLGHSDADVLLHAIMDALLGAAGLGDIGRHFPNTDPRFKDNASMILLGHVAELVTRHRYRVGNIDSTLVLEEPKIAPFVDEMRKNIATVLKIDPSAVSVKATTQERIGAIGAGEGVAAHAVALLFPR
jgi:2-C-methyl-D-erythritol 2,4-cyclodiphosphate synthase